MTRNQYTAALENIDFHLEGDAFRLHLHMTNGNVIRDVTITDLRNDGLKEVIRCDRDDSPPIYVPIDQICFLQLSAG
jgi:hypothetical protein